MLLGRRGLPLNNIILSILIISFTSSIFLIAQSYPISFALSLLLITLMSGLVLIKLNLSWLFYALVLVFLGGVIIIVLYITSLVSNDKIRPRPGPTLYGVAAVSCFLALLSPQINKIILVKRTSSFKRVSVLYQISSLPLLLFSVVVLLLCIISVIKLVKFESGPLVKSF